MTPEQFLDWQAEQVQHALASDDLAGAADLLSLSVPYSREDNLVAKARTALRELGADYSGILAWINPDMRLAIIDCLDWGEESVLKQVQAILEPLLGGEDHVKTQNEGMAPPASEGWIEILKEIGEAQAHKHPGKLLPVWAERYAAEEWVAYSGPRGGTGWKNSVTGEIIYGGEKPGAGYDPQAAADEETEKSRQVARVRKKKQQELELSVAEDCETDNRIHGRTAHTTDQSATNQKWTTHPDMVRARESVISGLKRLGFSAKVSFWNGQNLSYSLTMIHTHVFGQDRRVSLSFANDGKVEIEGSERRRRQVVGPDDTIEDVTEKFFKALGLKHNPKNRQYGREDPLTYAAEDWSPYVGPDGGRGWVNHKTGTIRYVEERPGTKRTPKREAKEQLRAKVTAHRKVIESAKSEFLGHITKGEDLEAELFQLAYDNKAGKVLDLFQELYEDEGTDRLRGKFAKHVTNRLEDFRNLYNQAMKAHEAWLKPRHNPLEKEDQPKMLDLLLRTANYARDGGKYFQQIVRAQRAARRDLEGVQPDKGNPKPPPAPRPVPTKPPPPIPAQPPVPVKSAPAPGEDRLAALSARLGFDYENLDSLFASLTNELAAAKGPKKKPIETKLKSVRGLIFDRDSLRKAHSQPHMMYSAEEWSPYNGPAGGRGWQNTSTGDIVYGDRKPGGKKGRAGQGGTKKSRKKAARAAKPPAEAQAPETAIQDTSGGGHVWDLIKKAGHRAGQAEHIVAEFLSTGVDRNIAKLPASARAPVAATWWLTKLGTKAAFASYIIAQNAAEKAATEAGATPDEIATLKRWTMALDLTGAKALPVAVASILGPAAVVSSFVPVGSATYLAYSGARRPWVTLRAAKQAFVEFFRKAPKPSAPNEEPQRHAMEDGVQPGVIDDLKSLLLRMRQQQTPERIDWYMALVMTALDEGHSLADAMQAADRISQEVTGPDGGEIPPEMPVNVENAALRGASVAYSATAHKWVVGDDLGDFDPDHVHSFSTVQVNVHNPAILKLAESIADHDLAGDGREAKPHVTVLYGIHGDDPQAAISAISNFPPFDIVMGGISIFEVEEDPAKPDKGAYDVVKIDVESPELRRMHQALCESAEHSDAHPNYRPHITLAYVRSGAGRKYVGVSGFEGDSFTVNQVSFNDRYGQETVVTLRGEPSRYFMTDPEAPWAYEWVNEPTPRTRNKWRNTDNDEVRYQEHKPGSPEEKEGKVSARKAKLDEFRKDVSSKMTEPAKPHLPSEHHDAFLSKVLAGAGGSVSDSPRLVGALPGATVHFDIDQHSLQDGRVEVGVRLHHPAVERCHRTLQLHEDGSLTCSNVLFFMDKRMSGGGLGMKQFSEQVRYLASIGASKITTNAGKGGGMNGYYTWPRLGYDAPLKPAFKRALRGTAFRYFTKNGIDPAQADEKAHALSQAENISDLMATPEGREFWKAKGYYAEDIAFDLTPGSKSLKTLNEYLASKGQSPIEVDAEKAVAARAARLKDYPSVREAAAGASQATLAARPPRPPHYSHLSQEERKRVMEIDKSYKDHWQQAGLNLSAIYGAGANINSLAQKQADKLFDVWRTSPALSRLAHDPVYIIEAGHRLAYNDALIRRGDARFQDESLMPVHEAWESRAARAGIDRAELRRTARIFPSTIANHEEGLEDSYAKAFDYLKAQKEASRQSQ